MAAAAASTAAKSMLKQVKQWKCHGGLVRKYTHESTSTNTTMTFSVFLPPGAVVDDATPVPTVYWLSGLTCTDDNFVQKATAAFKAAAAEGIAVVCPDTSPRGAGIDGEDDGWDFGSGAGFYVNATTDKWRRHYNMYDYVTKELPTLCQTSLPLSGERKSIFGHSMGGHGALICFLRENLAALSTSSAAVYRSCSAFAPICHPTACPWGKKAFSGYLGDDESAWQEWDASVLLTRYNDAAAAATTTPASTSILVDQGAADEFYEQKQLLPESLTATARDSDAVKVNLRMQQGYDHSYFFISSFVEEHIRHHANALKK